MLNAIQAGILTSSTKERLEQLEETKRELEARIAEEKLAKPKVTEEFIRFWLLRFRKLDMSLKDQRQALVDTFINAIYLYDDKVLITFNYKEGTQTITFEEAAEAASKGNGSDLDCFIAIRKLKTCSGSFGSRAGTLSKYVILNCWDRLPQKSSRVNVNLSGARPLHLAAQDRSAA